MIDLFKSLAGILKNIFDFIIHSFQSLIKMFEFIDQLRIFFFNMFQLLPEFVLVFVILGVVVAIIYLILDKQTG